MDCPGHEGFMGLQCSSKDISFLDESLAFTSGRSELDSVDYCHLGGPFFDGTGRETTELVGELLCIVLCCGGG